MFLCMCVYMSLCMSMCLCVCVCVYISVYVWAKEPAQAWIGFYPVLFTIREL